jgi:hypothetical protein
MKPEYIIMSRLKNVYVSGYPKRHKIQSVWRPDFYYTKGLGLTFKGAQHIKNDLNKNSSREEFKVKRRN